MKRKRWRRWLPVLSLSVLLLAFASCATCPPTVSIELEWPEFPDPTDVVTMEAGVVSLPLDYWLEIAAYAVAVDRVRTIVGESIER